MLPTLALLGIFACPEVVSVDWRTNQPSSLLGSAAEMLAELPNVHWSEYRVDPYIRAAETLQALGKDRACERLREMAKWEDQGIKVIVLCRRLFRADSPWRFRRPLLGEPGFLGRTRMVDWPLEPIEIADGIPFLITHGYDLIGQPESALHYLDHCLEWCHWHNTISYSRKTEAEQRQALAHLLGTKRWELPLEPSEREFLESQLQ